MTPDRKLITDIMESPDEFDICQNNHKGNPESVAANRRVDKARNEKLVLNAIAALGEASSEMVELHLGWSHQSVSSRFSDLKRKGLIVKSGNAKTKSGCSCTTYKII
jgi:predicted transcriptional regulator